MLAGLCVLGLMAVAHGEEAVQVQDAAETALLVLYEAGDPMEDTGNTLAEVYGGAGDGRMALVWLPLPSAVEAAQVDSVRLLVQVAQGDGATLRAQAVGTGWVMNGTVWDDVAGTLSGGAVQAAVAEDAKLAAAGWWALDITAYAKAWLSGGMDSNGVALLAADGQAVKIYTPFGEDAGRSPMLSITYAPREDAQVYGRFGFAPQEEGNCLAYALRDTDGIYLDAIVGDMEAFQQVYDEGGEAEALQYFWQAVQAYIAGHQQALAIESITPLDAWNSPVDTEKAYRVGLRIGFREYNGVEGIQVDGDFDFHLRVQLADGSWAEKTPGDPARVTPGSNASFDPGLYPWDQSFFWGYEKWADYYDSDVVYFAVVKQGDGFTQHLGEQAK